MRHLNAWYILSLASHRFRSKFPLLLQRWINFCESLIFFFSLWVYNDTLFKFISSDYGQQLIHSVLGVMQNRHFPSRVFTSVSGLCLTILTFMYLPCIPCLLNVCLPSIPTIGGNKKTRSSNNLVCPISSKT